MNGRDFFRGALCALVLSAAGSVANAETGERLEVKVPFAFTVGEVSLQPGTYTITESSSAGVLRIRGESPRSDVLLVTSTIGPSRSLNDGRLVFRGEGDRRALAEVWMPGAGGRQIPRYREVATVAKRSRTMGRVPAALTAARP